jgi:pseudouridine-5'-phosphate glycosidase
LQKIGPRDIGAAIAGGGSGGTTVAGTILLAERAGIRFFATGGIGGVHRPYGWDVSADLPQLARTPLIVACSGAKAILDLPATLEFLETHRVRLSATKRMNSPLSLGGQRAAVRLRCESPGGSSPWLHPLEMGRTRAAGRHPAAG